jgi:hypothetical protein
VIRNGGEFAASLPAAAKRSIAGAIGRIGTDPHRFCR